MHDAVKTPSPIRRQRNSLSLERSWRLYTITAGYSASEKSVAVPHAKKNRAVSSYEYYHTISFQKAELGKKFTSKKCENVITGFPTTLARDC